MKLYPIKSETLIGLADVVRTKAGMSEKMTPAQIAEHIYPKPQADEGHIMLTFENSPEDGEFKIDKNLPVDAIENKYITKILNYTFLQNFKLKKVNFPNCEKIGEGAFRFCYSLAEASFLTCKIIGDFAFAHCRNLNTIYFPHCEEIGTGCFIEAFYSGSIDHSTILNTFSRCKVIGEQAFLGSVTYGISEVYFPECLKIGSGAFSRGTMWSPTITKISFPKCTQVGRNAFNEQYSLKDINMFNCEYLDSYAFFHCWNLETIVFPKCSWIGEGAFNECTALKELYLSNDELIIYPSAFKNCASLQSVFLSPNSIATLTNINAFENTPLEPSFEDGQYVDTGAYFYVPQSLFNDYVADTNWIYYASKFKTYERAFTSEQLSRLFNGDSNWKEGVTNE